MELAYMYKWAENTVIQSNSLAAFMFLRMKQNPLVRGKRWCFSTGKPLDSANSTLILCFSGVNRVPSANRHSCVQARCVETAKTMNYTLLVQNTAGAIGYMYLLACWQDSPKDFYKLLSVSFHLWSSYVKEMDIPWIRMSNQFLEDI